MGERIRMITRDTAGAAATRTEFGDFLRTRRMRLRPEDVGVVRSRTRRTPGLRREEVAERAGFGVDWYIRLEQGRVATPPQATIDAISRALLLDATEHAHLSTLAARMQPPSEGPNSVPYELRMLLDTLDRPAYVTTRRCDVIAWNAAAAAAFGDFAAMPIEDRNLVVYFLLNPTSRSLFGDAWKTEARRVLTQFRATFDRWAGEPSFIALADRLRRESPEFAAWWDSHDVARAGNGVKTIFHPTRGVLGFTYTTFLPCDDVSLKLALYTPIEAAP